MANTGQNNPYHEGFPQGYNIIKLPADNLSLHNMGADIRDGSNQAE